MRSETLKTLLLGAALMVFGLGPTPSITIRAMQSDKPAQTFKIEDLAWLSGDWETAPGRMQIDEHWTKVAGGSMIGMSRATATTSAASSSGRSRSAPSPRKAWGMGPRPCYTKIW